MNGIAKTAPNLYWSAGFVPVFALLLSAAPLAQAAHIHDETPPIVQAVPAVPALSEHWLSDGLRDVLKSPSSASRISAATTRQFCSRRRLPRAGCCPLRSMWPSARFRPL